MTGTLMIQRSLVAGMSIADAIRAAYQGRVTQVEAAEALGVSQRTISDWSSRTDGKLAEWLEQLAKLEELAGRPRGWILVQAGYMSDVTTVEEAIEMDPRLNDGDRLSLRALFEGALKAAE